MGSRPTRAFLKARPMARGRHFTARLTERIPSLALTINNPPGHRVLAISFTADHVKLMFVAIILMIIARVMNEGREIYDENQLTV